MKAMILAAGLGTRLKPLTDQIPKPLVPVNGLPLIFYNLALLAKYKIREVVINLHYRGEQIEQLLGNGRKWGFQFRYSYEPEILGTGGGIYKAQKLLGKKTFFVLNGDIIIDCHLGKLAKFHQHQKAYATLVVQKMPKRAKFGALYVDNHQNIVAILDPPKGKQKVSPFVFTGVHVLDKGALNLLEPNQKQCIVRHAYIPLLHKGKRLAAFTKVGYWNDLGTVERLQQTERALKKQKIRLNYSKELNRLRKIYGSQ